ncbi:MAG: thioredoxin domain-containing protein [Planctomycetota bacterium]
MVLEIPSDKSQVVLFKSPSCGNCERLLPIFQEAIMPYQDKIKTKIVDITQDMDSAVHYGVFSVPTVIFFKNGQETARLPGIASRDKITNLLQQIL